MVGLQMTCSAVSRVVAAQSAAVAVRGVARIFKRGGGAQCVTPRVLTTLSCRKYFDTKQI